MTPATVTLTGSGRERASPVALGPLHVTTRPDRTHVWADVAVDVAGAYQAAHFPGEPVLPGVAMIDLVEQAVARVAGRTGDPPALTEIVSARFTLPARAGRRVRMTAVVPAATAGGFQVDATFELASEPEPESGSGPDSDGDPAGSRVARVRVRFELPGQP